MMIGPFRYSAVNYVCMMMLNYIYFLCPISFASFMLLFLLPSFFFFKSIAVCFYIASYQISLVMSN